MTADVILLHPRSHGWMQLKSADPRDPPAITLNIFSEREDFETVRTWAAAEAPGSVDRVTGKLLAQAVVQGREMPFAEAADLALEYHEAADNDDVLAEFLGSRAVRQDGNRERARELAGQISDEKRREEILKNLR